jgi:hypothetical protein
MEVQGLNYEKYEKFMVTKKPFQLKLTKIKKRRFSDGIR